MEFLLRTDEYFVDENGHHVCDSSGIATRCASDTLINVSEDVINRIKAERVLENRNPETGEFNPYTEVPPEELTEQEQRIVMLMVNGRKERDCCEYIIDFLAGYFTSLDLTEEQISSLLITFVDIDTALKGFRAYQSKALINALELDMIVTQVLKDDINIIFSKYGI